MTGSAVALFARVPSSDGKTRLRPHLSSGRVHALSQALLADALAVLSATPQFESFVFFTPESGRDEMRSLAPPEATLVPQDGLDLGERMRRALERLLGDGRHQRAILVGADIPLLTPAHLVEALVALRDERDVAIGPADDGGYYLIGMRKPHARLFEGVRWGTRTVLADTLARARAGGLAPIELQPLYDIDTLPDLRRAERDLEAMPRDVAANLRRWLIAA